MCIYLLQNFLKRGTGLAGPCATSFNIKRVEDGRGKREEVSVATGGGEQVENVLQEFADSLGRNAFLFGLDPKSGNEC